MGNKKEPSIYCYCCKKEVLYNEIYTKSSILFNGCKNCYDYLTELLNNLTPNKKRKKNYCLEKCKCFNKKYCFYTKDCIGTECIVTPQILKEKGEAI